MIQAKCINKFRDKNGLIITKDQVIKVFEIKAKSYSNWEDIVETKLIIRKA